MHCKTIKVKPREDTPTELMTDFEGDPNIHKAMWINNVSDYNAENNFSVTICKTNSFF